MSSTLKKIGIILLISIFLELVIFNFRTWESLFFKEIDYSYTFEVGDGINNNGNGTMTILNDGEQSLIIKDINQKVDNFRLNFNIIEPNEEEIIVTDISISDEGNNNYYYVGNHININNNLRSTYERIHPYGKLKDLKVTLSLKPFTKIGFNDISFNKRVPLLFSPLRLLITLLIISLFYIFRSKSSIYKIDFKDNIKKIISVIVISLEIIFLIGICYTNPRFINPSDASLTQYQRLAESISNGDFYLYDEPSKELMELNNPYDLSEREEKNVDYLWDHAYYNGKYYVYFGVGPVLLYYLPYNLITGNNLANHIPIIISLIIYVIFTHLLINKIVKNNFNNIKFPIILFLSSVLVFGSGAFFVARQVDIYSVPIITALSLMVMGLFFWFDSKKEKGINNIKVFIGSIGVAYSLLCRPQLVLASLLALVIFNDEIKTIKDNKNNRKSFIIALLPFFIIGLFLSYYNYARFGSIFDFGANYNLTTNDMTKRGFVFDRTFDGLFKYLIELPIFTNSFPFIHSTIYEYKYFGITIYEDLYGGLLTSNIILFINCLIFELKKYFKNKNLYYFSLMSLIIGLTIIILDTQMSGILQRYFTDFSFFFFLSAIILIFVIIEELHDKEYINNIYFIIFVLGILSIMYNLSLFLIHSQNGLSVHNKSLYYYLYNILWWWR